MLLAVDVYLDIAHVWFGVIMYTVCETPLLKLKVTSQCAMDGDLDIWLCYIT